MSWLLNANNQDGNKQNITIINTPIKKVQAYRILGLDDDMDSEMTEEQKRDLDQTLTLFQSGLIDVEAARKHLGWI